MCYRVLPDSITFLTNIIMLLFWISLKFTARQRTAGVKIRKKNKGWNY